MATCPACNAPDLTVMRKGGWLCEECDRRFAELPSELASMPASGASDLADLPFPVAYPLSWALDPSLSPGDRIENAIFAAYQAMRLTGLLLLADYLACETTSRRLAGPIRGLRMPHWGEWTLLAHQLARFWRGDFGPDEQPPRPSRFESLVDGWLDVNRNGAPKRGDDPWKELLEGLPGKQGRATNATSANDAVQKLRNDRAHRMATRTADQGEDERLLGRLLPVVERSIARLFPSGSLDLVRCVERAPSGLRVLRLAGAHRDLRFELESLDASWASAFDVTGVAALVGDVAVPVYPLFVAGDEEPEACRVGSGGLVEPVSLVDGVKEKRLVLLGVKSSGESERHVGPLLEALARKQVDPGQDRAGTTRWTLAGWSRATARESVNSLRGRKYFPECYIERRGVDDVVGMCMERPGRALLLLGEAGSGKSSLLARLADRLSAEDAPDAAEPAVSSGGKKDKGDQLGRYFAAKGGGDVVLFLSGHAAFAGDAGKDGAALLCDAVLQRAGVRAGTFRDLAEFAERLAETASEDSHEGRLVWLVFDALNEAARFTDVLTALDAFLPCVAKYPWLRVVVSVRSGAWHSVVRRRLDGAEHGDGVLANEGCLHAFHDERSGKDLPYLDLRPFNEVDEGPRAYTIRQTALPDRASSIPYAQLAPDLRRLLLSPLHLHLFHETFRGDRGVPSAIDEGVLLDAYLEHLCTDLPSLRETLGDIGRLMLERRAPVLPLDVADEWLARWRAARGYESVARVVKLDPIEELVAASVLMRPSEEGIGVDRRLVAFQFSHQKLCERVLLRELLRRISPRTLPTGEELREWAMNACRANACEFDEEAGALEQVAQQLARAGEGDVLGALLDIEEAEVRSRLLGAAIRSLGPQWGTSSIGDLRAAKVVHALAAHGIRTGGTPDANLRHRRGQTASATMAEGMEPTWDVDSPPDDIGDDLPTDEFLFSVAGTERAAVSPFKGGAVEALENSTSDFSAVPVVDRSIGVFDKNISKGQMHVLFHRGQPLPCTASCRLTYAGGQKSGWLSICYQGDSHGASEVIGTFVFPKLPSQHGLENLLDVEFRVDVGRVLTLVARDRSTGTSCHSCVHVGKLDARLCGDRSAQLWHRVRVRMSPRIQMSEGCSTRLEESTWRATRWLAASGFSRAAEAMIRARLEVLRKLIAANDLRSDLRRDMAGVLVGLGSLASAAGRHREARGVFAESLVVMRQLVTSEPDDVILRRDLTEVLRSVGNVAQDSGEADAARAALGEAISEMRQLVAAQSESLEFKCVLAGCLDEFGGLARDMGRYGEARGCFAEALAIRRRLVVVDSARVDWQHDCATSLNHVGILAHDANRSDVALPLFVEALGILRGLVAAEVHRADLRHGLAMTLTNLGKLSHEAGRRDEASVFFEEGLALVRGLVSAQPHRADLRQVLAVMLGNMGTHALAEGREDDARSYFEECVAAMRRLVGIELGGSYLQFLWVAALENLGSVERRSGRFYDAMLAFEEAVGTLRLLADAEPHRIDLRSHLASSLAEMGFFADALLLPDRSVALLRESLEVRLDLQRAVPWKSGRAPDTGSRIVLRDVVRRRPVVACPNCAARYRIPIQRTWTADLRIRCPSCAHRFPARIDGEVSAND